MSKSEFQNIKDFTRILGLENKTDGTRFIYKKIFDRNDPCKPDGYYYANGVTFILDAKSENKDFTGQLENYMQKEKNENFVGFKYSRNEFECYINGVFQDNELIPNKYDYYLEKYFKNIIKTNEKIVSDSAKKLANLFRDSGINKQMNVPFIGAVMLCLKKSTHEELPRIFNAENTKNLLHQISEKIDEIISDNDPPERKEKKVYISKKVLNDGSLIKADLVDVQNIIEEISTIYNFINIADKTGHDTMNSFLKIFRKWNSVDSQEKGEVFTPDHIAQLMYKLINCSKNDIILDPTCGSGTFLTNALINMINETNDYEERKIIKENKIWGIEKDDFNATLAGINMMLHGDGASHIYCVDCFKKLPRWNGQYNKVLMNPPFSQRKNPELKFVKATLDNMKTDGLLATILPNNCFIGSKKNVKKFRKQILQKHTLLKIVRLPKQLFYPTNVATSIAVFKAGKRHNINNDVENYRFLDDGFILIKHRGRFDVNYENKIKDFWNQKPILKKISWDNNWLVRQELDYQKLTKDDFIKTKFEFCQFLLDAAPYKKEALHLMKVLENKNNFACSNKPLYTEKWKEFNFTEIFDVKKCIGYKTLDLEEGNIPYVARKGSNNGVTEYCNNKERYSGNSFTIHHEWTENYTPFYQPFDFITDGMIYRFVPIDNNSNINVFNGLFIVTVLKNIEAELKSDRKCGLTSIKIKLPSNDGKPDWKYMEKYIKNEL